MTLHRRRMGRLLKGMVFDVEHYELVDAHGGAHRREVVAHLGGVAVLPVHGDRVVMVRQYRVALDRFVLEIPAGTRDIPGEPVEATATRELSEEIGATAASLVDLGVVAPSPGYTSELIHLFAAEGIVFGNRRPDGLEEDLAEVIEVPLTEALAMTDRGEIVDAKTQIALYRWARRMPT